MAIGPPSEGAKPPLVTVPTVAAVCVQDLGAFARGRAFDQQADAERGRRRRAMLAQDALGAGEIRGLAPALRDGEAEIGFDRRGGLVEVVAVKRQAGLEAQRIARAEADRLDALIGEQSCSTTRRLARRERESRSRPRRCSRSAK